VLGKADHALASGEDDPNGDAVQGFQMTRHFNR